MNYSSMLKESIEYRMEDYDDTDFIEVFIKSFRKWSSEKLSEEENNLPFSYLIRKHGLPFYNDLIGYNNTYITNLLTHNNSDISKIALIIGKELVKKGLQKLPSFRINTRFMDTYGKYIQRFIKNLNPPDWIKISLQSERPYEVDIFLKYDYDNFLKTDLSEDTVRSFKLRIKNFILDTLGLKIGNPIYGEIRLNFIEDTNVEDWVKKVLNGVIKKDIKKIENANKLVHSIRFQGLTYTAKLQIVRKSNTSFSDFRIFKEKVLEYLREKGYKRIDVDY